jgi:aryl-alcohol dehydrogenase-like predicted oxidoreductase
MLTVNHRLPYVRLGKSGLKVSRLILGCMSYGSPEWRKWVLGEEEAIEQIKFAYENGIQTFDTANIYSNGVSEIVLGKAIKQLNLPREEIVVMTKLRRAVSRSVGEEIGSSKDPDKLGYVNQHGLSRKHIFDAVQHSLQRLQLDYIDVLQCHRFDNDTPIEEVMQALHDVVQKGWVRYIGMSSCWAWQFHQMQNYAINNRLTPFISMQNHYNLIYREEEREMMPTLKVKLRLRFFAVVRYSAPINFISTLVSVRSRGLRLPAVPSHTPSESTLSVPITTGAPNPFTCETGNALLTRLV